jgi:hypothetical protein
LLICRHMHFKMTIETDLNKIKRLSEENEDGTWEFRSFLKKRLFESRF